MSLSAWFKTKHGTTNYKSLLPFINAVDNEGGSRHFKADGFMDLVIENLQRTEYFLGSPMKVYSISHYGEQNGDLMADPDMEIGVINDGEHMRIIPMTFRNDYMGVNQSVFHLTMDDYLYSKQLLTDLDDFLWQWLKNIEQQGFYDDINSKQDIIDEIELEEMMEEEIDF